MLQKRIAAFITACSLLAGCQGAPVRLVTSAAQSPHQQKGVGVAQLHPHKMQDATALVKGLPNVVPYRGPVKIKIDTGLNTRAPRLLSTRQVFDLSKHQSGTQHADRDSDLYFNPDSFPADLSPNIGDQPLSLGQDGQDIYLSTSVLDGQVEECVAGLLEIKFKPEYAASLDKFISDYNARVISRNSYSSVLQIDLHKSKLSTLHLSLENYNSVSPLPIKDITFSSVAAAQTMAALLDLTTNHAAEIEYAIPVSMSSPEYSNDQNRFPVLNRHGLDRDILDTGYPFIDTLEGYRPFFGSTENRSSQIDWVRQIQLPESRLYSDGRGATIAFIDSGYNLRDVIDISSDRITHKWNFFWVDWWFTLFNKENPERLAPPGWDPRNHGTYCVSVATAGMDNGVGAVGVAPRANIMELRAIVPDEWGQAIDYAVNNGADVISISVSAKILGPARKRSMLYLLYDARRRGYPISMYEIIRATFGSLAEAIYRAWERNVIIVSAAGNQGTKVHKFNPSNFFEDGFVRDLELDYHVPSCFEPVVAVGNAGRGTTPGLFSEHFPTSNYGPGVDIWAPGDSLEVSADSQEPNDRIYEAGFITGTSFSAPIVAGVAALMKSRNKTLSSQEIKSLLLQHTGREIPMPGGLPSGRMVDALGATEHTPVVGRTSRVAEIEGYLQMGISGTPVFVRDEGFPRVIAFDPTFPVGDPQEHLVVAGWWDNFDGARFHASIIRNAPRRPRFRLQGYVASATTGAPMAHATVNLRSGIDACDGTLVASTQTDSNGQYQFVDIVEGNYTVTIDQAGFVRICSNVAVNEQNPNGSGQTSIVTSPTLPSNGTRFVAVWGSSPSDLDSHLTGPTADGGRFHVYYGNRSHSDALGSATLDRDVTSGFGPETITNTVETSQNGIYRYALHDYSNRASITSDALSNSGVSLLVFRGDQLIHTIRPPANTPGTVWNALEMNGQTGHITILNQMGFQSDPAYVIQSANGGLTEFARLLKGIPRKQ